MQVLVVSSPTAVKNEAGIINDLFDAGLECFHIRKPGSTEAEVITLLNSIRTGFQNRLVLHQHHQLAGSAGIHRLHFPEHKRLEMKARDWEHLAEKGFTVSSSIHHMADYETLPEQMEYVFYGPVFDSISKQGYGPGSADLPDLKNKNKTGIVAIGGITPGHIKSLEAHCFDGAALLGAIWSEPGKAVSVFKNCLEKNH